MWFYLTFAIIAGGCASFVIYSMIKSGAPDSEATTGDAPQDIAKDVAFYQRQLAEIDRDVAKGTLSEEEAARTRVETSRRLIAADKRAQDRGMAANAPKPASYIAALAVTALLFGGGGYLYSVLGDSGRPDAPLAERYQLGETAYKARVSQEEAEQDAPDRSVDIRAEDLELIEQLRAALKDRPDDAVGHRLLAKQEASLGNFTAARLAQSRVIEIAGPTDAETNDLIMLGRIMVYGTAGYVSPQAEAIWGEILARDPSVPEARFYMGLMFTQTERPDVAYPFWEPLLETADPNAPWMETVFEQFPTVAYFAGEKYEPQASALPGPDADQVTAAQEMSQEDRQQMILDMVASLGDRLESGEGTAQEWGRYIRANAVLGNQDIAKEAFEAATIEFADDPTGADLIRRSGIEAGLLEGAQE